MNASQRILLQLTRAALWHTEESYAPDTDWNAVLTEAQQQRILGLAISALPDSAPKDSFGAFFAWQDAALASYLRYLSAQEALTRLLDEAGIPFAVLKGAAAAIAYETPSLRAMGDIDFVVPKDRFEQTLECMRAAGYGDHTPLSYRHIGLVKDGVEFEVHHHFSYDDMDIEAYIERGLSSRVRMELDGSPFWMLPPLVNGLVLLTHMRNHLKVSLGLRQVIDWMLYAQQTLTDSYFESTFRPAIEPLGLLPLCRAITRLCQLYLGLPNTLRWCTDADEALCGELLESLLASGNFGRKKGIGGKMEASLHGFRKHGLGQLQLSGESHWKAYKRHPWLRPFCWIYAIGRYTKEVIDLRISPSRFTESTKEVAKRRAMLKRLGIV